MAGRSLTNAQVAPASTLWSIRLFSFSTSAYTRFAFAPDTATPILPTMHRGRPGLRVISVHVSPPSVLLNRPLPGPPDDIWYSVRYASHSAAYMTLGFVRSIAMSTAPVLSSRNSTRRQVRPPSVLLNTPRSALGTLYFPNEATKTIWRSVG